ncbi:MAG: hypothetical protein KatS3mg131_2786 [Candidatus Tectimicrobiota bacterium]|nr:MAG: hypothetical protein KatS3mg131_2786 [Candidatus Tectomicrobia bacterium]
MRGKQGFTVLELVIAMAVAGIVIAAIYQVFHGQQRAFLAQNQVVEMQQNLRAALYLLTRELRSAGFDPAGTANAGIVTQFPGPNPPFTIDYARDTSIVAFTLDDDGDGAIDANDNEQVAYRLNGTTLERFSVAANAWLPVATNVDALDFVFLDENGNQTTDPAAFRAVEIALLARTSRSDPTYTTTTVYTNRYGRSLCRDCPGDHFRRRLYLTTVQLRNLGL